MESIPITILAGSDQRVGRLPKSGAGLHPLGVYKGAQLGIGGRPLVAVLVERLVAAGGFGPISVAGPERLHADLGLGVELVDTDGSVADNLRAALAHHARRAHRTVATMACDVLPSAEELARLRAQYEAERPCAVWFPLVRRPADERLLGPFAWKPRYELARAESGESGDSGGLEVLPGHLAFLQPEALRLELLLRLMDVAYATRNTPLGRRRWVMSRAILAWLAREDWQRLKRGRAPSLTWRTITTGFGLARGLRARALDVRQIERRLARVFLADQRACVRFPVIEMLSLAEDIDTQEEADALHLGRPEVPGSQPAPRGP